MTLKDKIKPHEGWRTFPYKDPKGIWTIGWGRNMEKGFSKEEKKLLGFPARDLFKTGITKEEGEVLLNNDINEAIELAESLPFFEELDNVRKAVVVEMIFNMGFKKFMGFHDTIACLEISDYEGAAAEIRDSDMYRQTGHRGEELRLMMLTGNVA